MPVQKQVDKVLKYVELGKKEGECGWARTSGLTAGLAGVESWVHA